VPPKDDDAGTFCVTDVGGALRMVFGKDSDVSLTATFVSYGAPPAGVFDPPTGYIRKVLQSPANWSQRNWSLRAV
jgi:hypothetical protein